MATSSVRCWDDNSRGQLGDETQVNHLTPTSDVLTDVQALAVGGFHTCALMAAGGVRCWGANTFATTAEGPPVLAPPSADVITGVQALAAGRDYACAALSSGGIQCWGDNEYGQGCEVPFRQGHSSIVNLCILMSGEAALCRPSNSCPSRARPAL
jgi:alpha-tubulin suppressor-like RCC1 family protein